MSNLLKLCQTISEAQDERELRSQVLPEIGKYFRAKRYGIFFFDQLLTNPKNLPANFQAAFSLEDNPFLRYLVERHTPFNEELAITARTWQLICPRKDHWHVMGGPLVNNGSLVGVIGLTRDLGMFAFDSQNLLDLGALCLHLSTWITKKHFDGIDREQLPNQISSTNRLTCRELQIAQLVARGKTNAQIGIELWITENSVKQALKRMFRKLEVSSRAEMVAQLFANTKFF